MVAGYRRHVRPEPEELERLSEVIRVRPVILDLWAFGHGRKEPGRRNAGIAASNDLAVAIAARAVAIAARAVDAFRDQRHAS